MIQITESEILEELRAALTPSMESPEGFYTTAEIAASVGKCPSVVKARLRELFLRGEIECVRVRRPAMDGRNAKVPAYRLRNRAA